MSSGLLSHTVQVAVGVKGFGIRIPLSWGGMYRWILVVFAGTCPIVKFFWRDCR